MNPAILKIVCNLGEADAALSLQKNDYDVTLKSRESAANLLSDALFDSGIRHSVAIVLDDEEILFCDYDDDDGFLFNRVRTLN